MDISAGIVNWNCQAQLSEGLWKVEEIGEGGSDSFTLFNDSMIFNDDFGALFLSARNVLPAKSVDILGQFLVNFCPTLVGEVAGKPDYDLDQQIEWIYSALSPTRVRSRLASLRECDLLECCRLLAAAAKDRPEDSVVDGPSVFPFIAMWAAAHGQAASKDWGLVVGGG